MRKGATLINAKPNPVDSPIVQQIIVSARHKPPNQKEPITLEQVNCIIDKLVGEKFSLIELRTACYIALKFRYFSDMKKCPNLKPLIEQNYKMAKV